MLFDQFIQDSVPSRELIARYSPLLPSGLLQAWKTYGFGSLMDGYLKIINPEEFQDLLDETYVLTGIPIFATAFADLVTWEKGRYLRAVKYKDGVFCGIAAGFDFFWDDLEQGAFDTAPFDLPQYRQAVRRWGPLDFDQCFAYVPLLSLGGSADIEHLHKAGLKEHIALIAQTSGKLGAAQM